MTATPSWADRLHAARNRLLASPRFQKWAEAFPLTRPIARRQSRALFDLCAGFVYTQVLAACVRLRLFDILADGPQTVAQVAERIGLPRDATSRLLLAAVSLRLATRRGPARFGLGTLGAAMRGNPAVGDMVAHHQLLYADLRDPVGLLRGDRSNTELAQYWPYAGAAHPVGLKAAQVDAYTALMSASQSFIADEVLDAFPLDKFRCLLDVGGGDGSFLTAAGARAPHMRLMLFDLPAVVDRARERLATKGLAERVTTVGGDFLTDTLPIGADVVSLIRIVHDHDEASVLTLFRAARRVLPAGGTLLVAEPMSGTRGAEPIGDAYFGFYLLAMGRGQPRTAREIRDLLRIAGFDRVRVLPTRRPMLARVVVARVPA